LEVLREFLQYGTSAKCDYPKQGNPVVRIPNVMDGQVRCDDLKWCEFSAKEIESLVLESGDVLFIRTNGVRERVGTCAVYRGQPERALFASYLIRARLKTDELNPDFFQYFTATAVGTSLLGGRASPAADGKFNVNTTTIDSILVPLPKPDEQREIVGILQTIDRKISVHERKRATLQELFQTMLHQLMTAQLRVHTLALDVSEVQA
jgi:type I restriction enzyme S subunit